MSTSKHVFLWLFKQGMVKDINTQSESLVYSDPTRLWYHLNLKFYLNKPPEPEHYFPHSVFSISDTFVVQFVQWLSRLCNCSELLELIS